MLERTLRRHCKVSGGLSDNISTGKSWLTVDVCFRFVPSTIFFYLYCLLNFREYKRVEVVDVRRSFVFFSLERYRTLFDVHLVREGFDSKAKTKLTGSCRQKRV